MNHEERSKQIYVLKAFAILSVVCAHMKLTISQGDVGWISNKIISVYAILGVAAFFICSGFFYSRKRGDSIEFWKKKLHTLVIPWVLWSILTFLLGILLTHQSFSVIELFKWSIGVQSWYYFVTVLLMLFVIFKLFQKKYLIGILIALSLVSNVLTILGIWRASEWMTPYLNPLNWVLFFALGILWRTYEYKISEIIHKNMCVCVGGGFLIFIILFYIQMLADTEITYWNKLSILFEISGFVVFMFISYWMRNVQILNNIGKNTYFIYLTHMQIVGVINTRLPQNSLFYLLKPMIGLIVVYLIGTMIIKIARVMKLDGYLWILGLRY